MNDKDLSVATCFIIAKATFFLTIHEYKQTLQKFFLRIFTLPFTISQSHLVIHTQLSYKCYKCIEIV